MDLVGARLGNIRVEAPLGAGGMGEVYRGFDVRLGRAVALKRLHGESVDAEMKARFLREAQLLTRLRHPAICEVYDLVEWRGDDVLIFELVEGVTLRQRLQEGPLPPSEALAVAAEVARGLAAAHGERVVHRDIKPENIMLEPAGGVRILDFGVSRVVVDADLIETQIIGRRGAAGSQFQGVEASEAPTEILSATLMSAAQTRLNRQTPSGEPPASESLTEQGSLLGTLAYMSPEQAQGLEVEGASDVYALGLVLQEMLSGETAHETKGRTLVDLLFRVQRGERRAFSSSDAAIDRLLSQLLTLEPSKRPSASSSARRLDAWLDRPRRRRQLRRWLLASAAILLIFAAAAWYLKVTKSELRRQGEREEAAVQVVTKFVEQVAPERSLGAPAPSPVQLQQQVELIESLFGGNPQLHADLLAKLGTVSWRLGDDAVAEQWLRQALTLLVNEPESADALRWRTRRDLANVLSTVGRFEEAEANFDRAVDGLEALGPSSRAELAATLNDLGALHYRTGRTDSAGDLYRRALDFQQQGIGRPLELAATLNNLALLEQRRGDYPSALELYGQSLALFRQHGEMHPDTVSTLNNLAVTRRKTGELEKAEEHQREALDVAERIFGGEHPNIGLMLYSYGRLRLAQNNPNGAEALLARSLTLLEPALGTSNPSVARTRVALADAWRRSGQLERASEALDSASEALEASLGPAHRFLAEAWHARGLLSRDLGRGEEASSQLQKALDIAVEVLGDGHPDLEPIRRDLRNQKSSNEGS